MILFGKVIYNLLMKMQIIIKLNCQINPNLIVNQLINQMNKKELNYSILPIIRLLENYLKQNIVENKNMKIISFRLDINYDLS